MSRNFGGDTPKNWTTPKLDISKLSDFENQIVYIGVIDPVQSKYSPNFERTPSLSFCQFLSKNWKKSKTSGSDCGANTPLTDPSSQDCVEYSVLFFSSMFDYENFSVETTHM